MQWFLPYQVAAEEEAEDEDKDGRPKHHNVDIEGKVLEPYIWHPETVMWEIGAHGYSAWRKRNKQHGAHKYFHFLTLIGLWQSFG